MGRRQQMTEQVETVQRSSSRIAQAHLRQTNKPDPAGRLLSTIPLTPLGFIKPTQDISIRNVKGRGMGAHSRSNDRKG